MLCVLLVCTFQHCLIKTQNGNSKRLFICQHGSNVSTDFFPDLAFSLWSQICNYFSWHLILKLFGINALTLLSSLHNSTCAKHWFYWLQCFPGPLIFQDPVLNTLLLPFSPFFFKCRCHISWSISGQTDPFEGNYQQKGQWTDWSGRHILAIILWLQQGKKHLF